MRRVTAIAVTALLLGAGCGSDDEGGRADTEARPTPEATDPGPAGPCPEGTPFVRARDVIAAAPGYELAPPADRKPTDTFAALFEEMLGERWRGHDVMVLVRRNAVNGTAVMVLNSHERSGPDGDVVRGAEAAARDQGFETEPVRVGREEGRLVPTADGGFMAIGSVGTCALVMLLGDTEARVRHAGSVVRQVD